ncbi:MAG: Mpo1-like protein [Candidatus Thermoplasmatota archaeon]
MKSVEAQLSIYASYHRDGTNKAIHALFVPLITWSAMGLLSFPILSPMIGLQPTPALLISAALLAYYLALDFTLGVVLTIAFTVLLATAAQIHTAVPTFAYPFFAVVFAVSWVAQILGHSVWEKRKPALVDNLFQILIAPLFVAAELLFALGLRRDLHAKIKEGLQAHLSA